MVLSTALLCLSFNVYFEARSEPRKGQDGIAHVVLNRQKDKRWRHLSTCQIVMQKHQFSWTKDKTTKAKGHYVINFRNGDYLDTQAFADAQNVALAAMQRKSKDPTNGAKFFCEKSKRPAWRKKLKHTVTIKNHAFYK